MNAFSTRKNNANFRHTLSLTDKATNGQTDIYIYETRKGEKILAGCHWHSWRSHLKSFLSRKDRVWKNKIILKSVSWALRVHREQVIKSVLFSLVVLTSDFFFNSRVKYWFAVFFSTKWSCFSPSCASNQFNSCLKPKSL